jgi:hypothetical protein
MRVAYQANQLDFSVIKFTLQLREDSLVCFKWGVSYLGYFNSQDRWLFSSQRVMENLSSCLNSYLLG